MNNAIVHNATMHSIIVYNAIVHTIIVHNAIVHRIILHTAIVPSIIVHNVIVHSIIEYDAIVHSIIVQNAIVHSYYCEHKYWDLSNEHTTCGGKKSYYDKGKVVSESLCRDIVYFMDEHMIWAIWDTWRSYSPSHRQRWQCLCVCTHPSIPLTSPCFIRPSPLATQPKRGLENFASRCAQTRIYK